MIMQKREGNIHTIYDRVGKRCLALSKRSTIQLINGLYEKSYPENSEVEYNWTEHHDDDLKKTLADTIVTINHKDSYHLEMQMTVDEDIVLRVFEYGFGHAIKHRSRSEYVLRFPRPLVLYFCEAELSPDYLTLSVVFEDQGTFDYRVPVVKFQQIPLQELKRRKLCVLLPFQILRLKKAIDKERTPENMRALKELIFHDIIDSIHENVEAGNLSQMEASKLVEMTLKLYRHIYNRYVEMEEVGMNTMVEDALVLEMDKYERRMNELILETDILERKVRQAEEKVAQAEEKASQAEEKAAQAEEKANQAEEKASMLEKEKLALRLMILGKPDEEIISITCLNERQLNALRK